MRRLSAAAILVLGLSLAAPSFGAGQLSSGLFTFKGVSCLTFRAGQNYRDASVVCDVIPPGQRYASGYAVGINRNWVWVINTKTNKVVWGAKQRPTVTTPLYP